jgi:hypothetical protein
VEGILTAAGQLAHASEFRFDFWRTREGEHRYFVVRRGSGHNDGRWAICNGNAGAAYWDGSEWDDNLRGPSAYRYDLDDALLMTKQLAFEENQRYVALLEAKYPGQIRGSYLDMASRGGGDSV